jgi:two-component system NtrC family sensor kinase
VTHRQILPVLDKEVDVFFMCSFSRRLVSLFCLALICLLLLSIPGVTGLIWHRDAVDDLDFLLYRSPDEARLSRHVAHIGEVLHTQVNTNYPEALRQLQLEYQNRISDAREELLEFRSRTDSLRPEIQQDVRQQQMALERLDRIEIELGRLLRLSDWIAPPPDEEVPATLVDIRFQTGVSIARMQRTLDTLPTSQTRDRMARTLERDRNRSSYLLALIAIVTLFSGLTLTALLYFGLRWVSVQVRELATGCIRIADGDIAYRLPRLSRWQDELADVVDGVNSIADRYQQSEEDLQQKVRERSDQLIRSQRLANVGFLAAGVAHEINNPLQAISMAADIVEMRVRSLNAEPDEDVHEIIRRAAMIRTESSRCGDITRRLLDFSRADHGVRTGCDLVGLVDEVRAMIGQMGRFGDRRVIFEPTGPVTAEVSAAQIKQVILNLTANALQAVSDDGEVEIRLIEQVDYVVLTVRDNGCGMTEETLQHVFDPFYSERQGGQGTGLGLSIIHRIIEDHDGTITPFSDGPGKGSTFSVRLPRRSRHCSAA